MPTGLERITPGVYADILIAAGAHWRSERDGGAERRLSYPAKIMAPSLTALKQGKRKRRRSVGMASAER